MKAPPLSRASAQESDSDYLCEIVTARALAGETDARKAIEKAARALKIQPARKGAKHVPAKRD